MLEVFGDFSNISTKSLTIYYIIVFITFIYIIHKYRKNLTNVIIILIFYFGMFAYLGKSFENPFKMIIFSLSIFAVIKNKALFISKVHDIRIIIMFSLFSISFFISVIYNKDYFVLSASQFSRYVIPLCFYFIFKRYAVKSPHIFKKFYYLFYNLLIIQILLSITKLFLIGIFESIVGSVYFIGGALATIIPILGFILIWVYKKEYFNKKDWLFIASLLIISFASNKRAIWFIMPIIILLFLFYIPKKQIKPRYFFILPLIPLIIYFGIRLSPTLNKENRVWGTFDINYTIKYSLNYSFGASDITGNRKEGRGRGGATLMLVKKLSSANTMDISDLIGNGLDEFYTKDYSEFDINKYGVDHKGAVNGFFQGYITNGFLGVLTFILYVYALISLITPRRVKFVFLIFFCWEYFLYTGVLFREPSLTILLVYFIVALRFKYVLNDDTLK